MARLASFTACLISIPAPARGATEISTALKPHQRISIPAPARGATGNGQALQGGAQYFNSRPCARGDAT